MTPGHVNGILEKLVSGGKTPSVQYLFFDQHKIIHSYISGNSNLAAQTPANETTLYHVYSFTKTFTAAAVMQLVEQKLIELDHPVKQYLPDFPYSDQITTRHLLTHTAGIPNPIPLSWIHLGEEDDTFDSDKYFKNVFLKSSRLKSTPGEKFAYTNLGYVLLGQIIEKITGRKYRQYISDQILKPLNINPLDLTFTVQDPSRKATGYHDKFTLTYMLLGFLLDKKKYMGNSYGKWRAFRDNHVNGDAYGGLVSTSRALAAYAMDLLSNQSKILSNNSKEELFTENLLANKKPSGMCLSWFTGLLNGNRYYTHAGGGGGYYCEVRLYRERGLGSVIMFNRTGISDERYLDHVDCHMLN